ncbi:MAG: hypothetical protein HZC41_23910 [Chloroflexi bacterium]|nr:hypothetical protein [Chloroflexota bacterium]
MSTAFRIAVVRAALVAGGVLFLLTGVAMLAAPEWFYSNIGTFPPYNRHYVGDMGSFQLPLGLALLWAARHPARHRLLVAYAAVGSLLHALNHTADDLAARVALADWVTGTLPLFLFAGVLALAYAFIPRSQPEPTTGTTVTGRAAGVQLPSR